MSKSPAVSLDPKTFEGPHETNDAGAVEAQVTIKGRNVEVPDHFVDRIHTKLAKIERMATSVQSFEVVLLHENNPRLSKVRQRMEVTARGKGGTARAEAGDDTFYAALESVVAKLQRQIRKARTRNKIAMQGHRRPQSVAEATADLAPPPEPETNDDKWEVDEQLPGQIVRRKEHDGSPMTVDDALERMELVGHDFYLFQDSESGRPTVVYRRHAFDYGLITLSNA